MSKYRKIPGVLELTDILNFSIQSNASKGKILG